MIAIVLCLYFNPFSRPSKEDKSTRKIASYHYAGETARIITPKGLNLRDQPGSSGTILLTVPYNDVVGIIDKKGNIETIAGRTANWYKVDYRGTTGWLWSGYLKGRLTVIPLSHRLDKNLNSRLLIQYNCRIMSVLRGRWAVVWHSFF